MCCWQGGSVYFFYIHTTDSTQNHAKAIVTLLPAYMFLCVQAGRQTVGRGQRGRIWDSRQGNLFLTVCVPLSRKISPGKLSIATGVSLATALQSLLLKQEGQSKAKLKIGLKWPNDILLNQKKCAGILIEINELVFIGIGINITSHPDDTLMPATHLLEHIADDGAITQNALILRIIDTIPNVEKLEDFTSVQELWWKFAKDSVPYWRVREPLNGNVLGIDEQGQLLIQSKTGQIIKRHQAFSE